MTVKELIEKLKVYNPDKEIFLTLDGREGFGMFALEVMPVECGCKDERQHVYGNYRLDSPPAGGLIPSRKETLNLPLCLGR